MDRSITIALLFFCACCGTLVSGTPLDFLQNRIVGGSRVRHREKFPYQVSLRIHGQHICGGTIYKPHYVITAAHCVNGLRAKQLKVVAGDLHLSWPTAYTQSSQVDVISVHDRYDGQARNDIAVLRLKKALIYNKYVQNATIWNAGKTNETSIATTGDGLMKCIVSGWGAVYYNGPVMKGLRAAEVSLLPEQTCQRIYDLTFVSMEMICAGDFSRSKDACSGDSGGPMVCQGQLYGIVSWGVECGRPQFPGVYTNASYYADWIDAHSGVTRLGWSFLIMTLATFCASCSYSTWRRALEQLQL